MFYARKLLYVSKTGAPVYRESALTTKARAIIWMNYAGNEGSELIETTEEEYYASRTVFGGKHAGNES